MIKRQDYEVKKNIQIFRFDHHKIYTERVRKTALNGADDKRIIHKDGVSTYAYGLYLKIDSEEMELSELCE